MSIKDFILLTLGCVLSSNYILVNFLSSETILSNDGRTLKSNLFSTLYLGLVLIVSSVVLWPLEKYLISGAGYLRVVVYTITILFVTAVFGLCLKKKFAAMLPVALSSGVLGSLLFFESSSYTFLETLSASLGVTLGYLLVTLALSSVREKVRDRYVPSAFQGAPIMLVSLSIIALTVYCF